MRDKNDKADNLAELFENAVKSYPDKPLFGTKGPDGEYQWHDYATIGARVDRVRAGLAQWGVGPGDAVGIIANNRPEWAIAAFATYGLRARFVPMYEAELPATWQYIIADSGIKVLWVSQPKIAETIHGMRERLPGLKHLCVIDADGPASLAELEQLGGGSPIPSAYPGSDEIAVLIYTSGTTGAPKGVLLSHSNLISNARAGYQVFSQLGAEDRSLSILPWAHSYGQTAELYNFIQFGGSIGFMESPQTLLADLAKVRPSFIIGVPRVFNRIYDGLWAAVAQKGGLAKKLFEMGIHSASKQRELEKAGKSDPLNQLKYKLADRLALAKVRERFGGRLKACLSGSAALNPEVVWFFFDLGIPLYDAYGLTETSPAITMNGPGAFRVGSVGRPIEGVRVAIDPLATEDGATDGEVIAYGPNVMQGYHNQPEATQAVMTEDGGFRTGDRGWLDADGFLYITGRIKEQFKLENGKFVFPAALEEDIRTLPLVANAMIHGANQPYTVCVVVPDFEVLGRWAQSQAGLPTDPEAMVNHPAVCDYLTEQIQGALAGKYGGYEIPKKFLFLSEDFSVENGMLTQTLKLKRRAAMERYGEDIEALY